MGLDIQMLYRQYLSKVTDDLRQAVLSKTWLLDGEEAPARKPATWEEVADAIDFELESRADAKAPKDMLRGTTETGGGYEPQRTGVGGQQKGYKGTGKGTLQCIFCLRTDHLVDLCPYKAAQSRGAVR